MGTGSWYFILFVFSVIRVGMGQPFMADKTAFFTTLLYCAAGGMLGGMLS